MSKMSLLSKRSIPGQRLVRHWHAHAKIHLIDTHSKCSKPLIRKDESRISWEKLREEYLIYVYVHTCVQGAAWKLAYKKDFLGVFTPQTRTNPPLSPLIAANIFEDMYFLRLWKEIEFPKKICHGSQVQLYLIVFSSGKNWIKDLKSLRLTFQKEVFPYCRRIIKCTDRSLTTRSQKSTDV